MNGSDKFVMKFENVYFINGTAYAGKSTMVKLLAEKPVPEVYVRLWKQ